MCACVSAGKSWHFGDLIPTLHHLQQSSPNLLLHPTRLSSGDKRLSSQGDHAFSHDLTWSITTGVSISPDRLRQVIDPVTSLLAHLHKLIFISQVGVAAYLWLLIVPIASTRVSTKQSTNTCEIVCKEIVLTAFWPCYIEVWAAQGTVGVADVQEVWL